MPETWVNIYLWLLIGGGLLGILLLIFRPLSRILGKPKNVDEYSKAIRWRMLIIEFLQLITGVTGLVLFKGGVLDGWAILIFCTFLLVGGVILLRFISTLQIEHKD